MGNIISDNEKEYCRVMILMNWETSVAPFSWMARRNNQKELKVLNWNASTDDEKLET